MEVCTLRLLVLKLQEGGEGFSLRLACVFRLTALGRLDRLPQVFALPATRLFVHDCLLNLSGVKRGEFTTLHHLWFF